MHLGSLIHKALEYLAEYPVYDNIDECIVKAINKLDVVITAEMVAQAQEMIKAWFSEDKFKNECMSSEYSFITKIDDDLVIRGIVDRVEKLEDGTLRVIDYKTGWQIYTYDDVKNSNQLIIYAMACQEKWEPDKMTICYDMIKYNRKVELEVYKEDIINKYEYLKRTYDRIKSGENEAILSSKCAYCWYKFSCISYLDYLRETLNIREISDILEGDFEDSIEYIKDLDNKKGLIEKHIKEIKGIILNEIISSGEKVLNYQDFTLYVKAKRTKKHNLGVIMEVFPDQLERVLRVSSTEVSKLIVDKNTEDKEKVLKSVTEMEGRPYLTIRKKKKK